MKFLHSVALAAVILTGCTVSPSNTQLLSEKEAINAMRAPIPESGAPEDTLSISGTSDASVQLTADKIYSISCTTDTHLRWGSTSPTAVATDLYLKTGVILFWRTGKLDGRYVAGIQNAASGACQINGYR